MLSDACSQFVQDLRTGDRAKAQEAARVFLDDVQHYADPKFGYPSAVLERLRAAVADFQAAHFAQRDLARLVELVRRAYDSPQGPGDLERRMDAVVERARAR